MKNKRDNWLFRITNVIFVNENHDEFLYKMRTTRQYKSEVDFIKGANKLLKYGKKKYGPETTITLTYDHK